MWRRTRCYTEGPNASTRDRLAYLFYRTFIVPFFHIMVQLGAIFVAYQRLIAGIVV
jgi:hypothetical protein